MDSQRIETHSTKRDPTDALKAIYDLYEGFNVWREVADDFEIGIEILKLRESDSKALSNDETKMIEEIKRNRDTLRRTQKELAEYQEKTKVTYESAPKRLKELYDEVAGLYEMQNLLLLNTEKVTSVHRLVYLRPEHSLGHDRSRCFRKAAQKRGRTGRKN